MITPAMNRGDGGGRGVQLALLPEPEFSPRFPSVSSLVGRALEFLLTGKALSQPIYLKITGSWRLAEHIRALRHDHGWPVSNVEIPAPSEECPERYIAEYSLPDWVLEEVHHG